MTLAHHADERVPEQALLVHRRPVQTREVFDPEVHFARLHRLSQLPGRGRDRPDVRAGRSRSQMRESRGRKTISPTSAMLNVNVRRVVAASKLGCRSTSFRI